MGLSPFRSTTSRILLVDDDPALLDALSSTLQFHLGHTSVETCSAAQHALNCVGAQAYDTVISDVRMPQMDGVELLTRIQQIRPTTPTVLISWHSDQALLGKAYELGALDFVFKPIDRHEFLITIRRILHLSRLRSLMADQERFVTRCRNAYLQRVESLRQEMEPHALAGDSTRQQALNARLQTFRDRTIRHLARLDAYLDRVTRAHRETLAKLTVAEETCRRLADEKLTRSR